MRMQKRLTNQIKLVSLAELLSAVVMISTLRFCIDSYPHIVSVSYHGMPNDDRGIRTWSCRCREILPYTAVDRRWSSSSDHRCSSSGTFVLPRHVTSTPSLPVFCSRL